MKLKSLLNVCKVRHGQILKIYDSNTATTYRTGHITSEDAERLMNMNIASFYFDDNELRITVK